MAVKTKDTITMPLPEAADVSSVYSPKSTKSPNYISVSNHNNTGNNAIDKPRELSTRITTFTNLIEDTRNTTVERWASTKDLSQWKADIFSGSMVYYHENTKPWGPVILCIFKNEGTDGKVNVLSIDKFGTTLTENVDITPESQYYPAVESLEPTERNSNVKKCIAVTFLRRFAELDKEELQRVCEVTGVENLEFYDPVYAAELASGCKPMTSMIPETLCNYLYNLGLLQNRVLRSTLLDMVYENKDEVMQLNNRLVFYLGEQLEQLFNPVTEYSPEQTEYSYKPPANNLPTETDSSLVKAICNELLELQSKFTYELVEFLQKFLIVLRVKVLNNSIDGLSTSKLNRLFPPTIDEVTRINCIFLDSLRAATKYGSLEVLKACSITIPYFYKAYTRHEAATKNFSKDIKLFLKSFKDVIPQPEYYTEMKLESIIRGPQERLLKLKLIIERLYQKKKWSSPDVKNTAATNYTNIIEVIDSFANSNKPMSSYSTRVFTPSGKILTELAKGWPVELQYKWLKRRVVGVFDVVNVMSEGKRSLLVIFSDYIVLLNIIKPEKYYSKRKPHKPLISNILMNSLINEVPLPPKIPKLEVENFAHISDVVVSVLKDNLLRIDSMSLEEGKSFSTTCYVLSKKKSSVYDIAELVTKARVLEKDTAFHLFKYTEPNFTVYSTAHEIQSYENEGIKSKFAVFLNIEPSEYLLRTHKLHLAVFAKFCDPEGECDTIQLDYLSHNDPKTLVTVQCHSDKLMNVLLELLSRELPMCYSSIYSDLGKNILAINEGIIAKLLSASSDWFDGTQYTLLNSNDTVVPLKQASMSPMLGLEENRKSYGTITTFRSNVSDLKEASDSSTGNKKVEPTETKEDRWKSIAIESRAELKKTTKVKKEIKAKKLNSGVLPSNAAVKHATALADRGPIRPRKKGRFLEKILVFFSRDKSHTRENGKQKPEQMWTKNSKRKKDVKIVYQGKKEPKFAHKVPAKKVMGTERDGTVRQTIVPGNPVSTFNVDFNPTKNSSDVVTGDLSSDKKNLVSELKNDAPGPIGIHHNSQAYTSVEKEGNSVSSSPLRVGEVNPLVGPAEGRSKDVFPLKSVSLSPPLTPPTNNKDKAQSSAITSSGSAVEGDKPTIHSSPIRTTNELIISPSTSMASKDEEVVGLGLSKVSVNESNEDLKVSPKSVAEKGEEGTDVGSHDRTNLKLANPMEHQSELFNDDLFGDFVPSEILNPRELQENKKNVHDFGEVVLPVTSIVQTSNGPKDLSSSTISKDIESIPEDDGDIYKGPTSRKEQHHIFPQIPRVPTTAFTITFDKSPSFNELYKKMRVVLDETDATYNWIRIPTEDSLSQKNAVNTGKQSVPGVSSTGNVINSAATEAEVSKNLHKDVQQPGTAVGGISVRRINASPGKHSSNDPRSLPLEFLNNKVNASPPPRNRPRISYNEGLKTLLKIDTPNLKRTNGNSKGKDEGECPEACRTGDPKKRNGSWLVNTDNDPSVIPETSLAKDIQLVLDDAFGLTDRHPAPPVKLVASEASSDVNVTSAAEMYKNLSARNSSDSKYPSSRTPSEEEYCTPFENPTDTVTDAEDSIMERVENRNESSQNTSAWTGGSPGHSSDMMIISETRIGEAPRSDAHEVPETVDYDDYVTQMLDELDFSSFHLDFDASGANDIVGKLPDNPGGFEVVKEDGPSFSQEQSRNSQSGINKPGVIIYRFPGKPLSSASLRLESRRRTNSRDEEDPIWVSPTKLEFYDLTRVPNIVTKSVARQATVVKRSPQPVKVNNSNLPKDLSYAFLADYIRVREDGHETTEISRRASAQRQSNHLQFV